MDHNTVVSIIAGIIGVLAGAGVTYFSLRQRVEAVIATCNERHNIVVLKIASFDVEIAKILNREHCGPCDKLSSASTKLLDERHTQILRRLDNSETKMDMFQTALVTNIDRVLAAVKSSRVQ